MTHEEYTRKGEIVDKIVNEEKINDLIRDLKSSNKYCKFDDSQLKEIALGFFNNVNTMVYENEGYTHHQMRVIREGLEHNLDVTCYASIKFDGFQMREIYDGLISGLDTKIYARPEFDSSQMYLIRIGMNFGIDVSQYADPSYGLIKMTCIGNALYNKLDPTPLLVLEEDDFLFNIYDKMLKSSGVEEPKNIFEIS